MTEEKKEKTRSLYEKTRWYCMNCGQREVWEERGSDDYYNGPFLLCVICVVSNREPGEVAKHFKYIADKIRSEKIGARIGEVQAYDA